MTSFSSNPRRPSEFATIAKYFAPLSAGAPGAFGLQDDVATLSLPQGRELVAKVDAIVESVHFQRADPASLVAKKALRAALSDLAAKGATPIGYLLSLSLAATADEDWIAEFARGLAEDQEQYGLSLIGGDTTATPGALTISVTALGSIATGMTPRRGGARTGDCVFVTGTIGDAGAGLAVLKGEGGALAPTDRDALILRYRLPEPRLAFGHRLPGMASASLDVSDGLIADLGHIARASGVRIAIDAARIPLSAAVAALWGRGVDAVLRAATSGDDYEIAFTAPGSARASLVAAARDMGLGLSEIGVVETSESGESGEGVLLLDRGNPVEVTRAGYTHF
jgi:thiamine-monophosphate kinase